MTMECYRALHHQITLLAYQYIGELEEAEDIASDYLIAWWQQTLNTEKLPLVSPCFSSDLIESCDAVKIRMEERILSEHHFILDQMVSVPAYKVFRLAEKEIVLHLSRSLHPLEQAVIHFILIDGYDLPEISTILKRPVPTIKILRDRATSILKKKLRK